MRINVFPKNAGAQPRLQIFEQHNEVPKIDYELTPDKLTSLIKKLVNQLPAEVPKGVSVYEIEERLKQFVIDEFDLESGDFWKRTRDRDILRPRQILMYLLKKHCDFSYPKIGVILGMHHTTAIHSVKHVENLMLHCDIINEHIAVIEENLKNWRIRRVVQ